jgi:hypothetical protein
MLLVTGTLDEGETLVEDGAADEDAPFSLAKSESGPSVP